jgi:hypothetical protein
MRRTGAYSRRKRNEKEIEFFFFASRVLGFILMPVIMIEQD